MNSLINRANKQVENIKRDLSDLHNLLEGSLETSSPAHSPSATTLIGQLSASFSGLQSTIRDLDALARNEVVAEKRELCKEYPDSASERSFTVIVFCSKLRVLNADLATSKQKFANLRLKHQEGEHMRQKEELFSLTKNRTQTSGAAATEGDHLLNTQEMYARREDEVLSNTSSRLDEYISIGLSTIADLRSQKNSIKSTHRRLMDATASLGVSQSLMRVIGRMSSQERVIFYSGILATLIVIIVLWRYF